MKKTRPYDQWTCWECQMKNEENKPMEQRKKRDTGSVYNQHIRHRPVISQEIGNGHDIYQEDDDDDDDSDGFNNGVSSDDRLQFQSIDEFQRKRKGKYVEQYHDNDDEIDEDDAGIEIDGLKFHRI